MTRRHAAAAAASAPMSPVPSYDSSASSPTRMSALTADTTSNRYRVTGREHSGKADAAAPADERAELADCDGPVVVPALCLRQKRGQRLIRAGGEQHLVGRQPPAPARGRSRPPSGLSKGRAKPGGLRIVAAVHVSHADSIHVFDDRCRSARPAGPAASGCSAGVPRAGRGRPVPLPGPGKAVKAAPLSSTARPR